MKQLKIAFIFILSLARINFKWPPLSITLLITSQFLFQKRGLELPTPNGSRRECSFQKSILSSNISFILLLGFLSGCSLHSGSAYEQGEMGEPAYFKKGVILSVRDIKIKGRESGVGAIAGATAGGLAGSTLGENMATKVLLKTNKIMNLQNILKEEEIIHLQK